MTLTATPRTTHTVPAHQTLSSRLRHLDPVRPPYRLTNLRPSPPANHGALHVILPLSSDQCLNSARDFPGLNEVEREALFTKVKHYPPPAGTANGYRRTVNGAYGGREATGPCHTTNGRHLSRSHLTSTKTTTFAAVNCTLSPSQTFTRRLGGRWRELCHHGGLARQGELQGLATAANGLGG